MSRISSDLRQRLTLQWKKTLANSNRTITLNRSPTELCSRHEFLGLPGAQRASKPERERARARERDAQGDARFYYCEVARVQLRRGSSSKGARELRVDDVDHDDDDADDDVDGADATRRSSRRGDGCEAGIRNPVGGVSNGGVR